MTWRAVLGLILVSTFARAARADVEALIPGPPIPASFDDRALGEIKREVAQDRNSWVNRIRRIPGVTVSQLAQGSTVSCVSSVEQRLLIEGYKIVRLADLPIYLKSWGKDGDREALIKQAALALRGHLEHKLAIRMLPSFYIAITPRPDLNDEKDRERALTEVMQGLRFGGLGTVRAYLYRHFAEPVGWVCMECQMSDRAGMESLSRLLEMGLGAVIVNQMSADREELFRQTIIQKWGPAMRGEVDQPDWVPHRTFESPGPPRAK